MYKSIFAAAAVLAQVSMPQPMPVRMPAVLSAQQGVSDGITVTGTGYARAQASRAQVTLRISTRNNATSLSAQTLQPIVDALVRAGADRSSIIVPPYLLGQARTNNAAISATVLHPTLAMLQQGMLTIANAFASEPDLLLNSAEVVLSADGCAQLQRTAEAHAIANARSNAAFIAGTIGAHAGDVLAVEERSIPIGSEGACTMTYSVTPYGGPYPPMSPAEMLTVNVSSAVTMRIAIRR